MQYCLNELDLNAWIEFKTLRYIEFTKMKGSLVFDNGSYCMAFVKVYDLYDD